MIHFRRTLKRPRPHAATSHSRWPLEKGEFKCKIALSQEIPIIIHAARTSELTALAALASVSGRRLLIRSVSRPISRQGPACAISPPLDLQSLSSSSSIFVHRPSPDRPRAASKSSRSRRLLLSANPRPFFHRFRPSQQSHNRPLDS